ncbi:pyridoxamine 5'-phosphate oxidase family protein [Candidatus Saccharibacteria bacterium]|nr:pyridoxamine 5'-phosphate oxidase family protein [Candidatus Saccharibacteria bacterium]
MPFRLSEEKPKITNFLNKNQIAVLATIGADNRPQTAVIYFYVDADLNIYFITKEKTTKYQNIIDNPEVALSVYEQETQTTVQASGKAEEVHDPGRVNEVFRHVLSVTKSTSESSIPPVSKIDAGGYKCFCIRPRSIRLAEYTKPEHGEHDGLFETVVVPDSQL